MGKCSLSEPILRRAMPVLCLLQGFWVQAGCRKGMELLCKPEILVQMQSFKQCPGTIPELRISWCKVTKKSERDGVVDATRVGRFRGQVEEPAIIILDSRTYKRFGSPNHRMERKLINTLRYLFLFSWVFPLGLCVKQINSPYTLTDFFQ